MKLFNKRSLKLKWRLLLIILPVAIIPISVIMTFIYGRILTYLDAERKTLNDTLVYQVTKNINDAYDKTVAKLPGILAPDEIKNNIYRNEFPNQIVEKETDDLVNGTDTNKIGLRERLNTLDVTGLIYIINKKLTSLVHETPYKQWLGGTINEQPNIGKLISQDRILKDMNKEITITAEGAKIAKPILGKLNEDTFSTNNSYISLLYPVVNVTASSPDPQSTDYNVFVMMLLTNIGSGGYIAENVKDVTSIDQGTVYVLDYKNDIMYCNYMKIYGGNDLDPEYDTDEEMGIYAEYINNDENILKDSDVQKAINQAEQEEGANYMSTVMNVKYKGHNYQTFVIDSAWKNGMNSGVKVVFFYPQEVISMKINSIILQMMIFILVFVILVVFLSVLISESLVRPISRLDYATNKVSQGYLDVDINTQSRDEIGSLYKNFKRMINTINEVLSNIQKSSNDLLGFQVTLDKVIANFETSITDQAKMVNDGNREFNTLNSSINEVVYNVRSSLAITKKSQEQVVNANQIIEEMVSEIRTIAETSGKINAITELINGISEQTRLLSLNAAIEASRSGESGKGFNVVASEIRKLASQSNQAANEIGGLIKMNDKSIKAGVEKTKEVIEALNDINTSFKTLTETVNKINQSANEEAKGGLTIMQIIDAISNEADKNMKFISELSRTRDQLSMEVKKMRNLILAFKVESDEKEIINDIGVDERVKLKQREKKLQVINEKQRQKLKKISDKLKAKNNENQIVSAADLKKQTRKGRSFFSFGGHVASLAKKKMVKIPQHIDKRKFNDRVLQKISLATEKEFLRSMYHYDEFNESYELGENISEIDRVMLGDLLKRIGFH